jgi:hypothetical protein
MLVIIFENFSNCSGKIFIKFVSSAMKQHSLKNVISCLNIKIYSYSETDGGQSSYLCLNVVQFFNASVKLTSMAA